jgi:hypothetical protein
MAYAVPETLSADELAFLGFDRFTVMSQFVGKGLQGLGAAEPTLTDLMRNTQAGVALLEPRFAQMKALLANKGTSSVAFKAAYKPYLEWSEALLNMFLKVGARLRASPKLLQRVIKDTGRSKQEILSAFDGNNFKPLLRVVPNPLGSLGIEPVTTAIVIAVLISAAVATTAWALSADERALLEREQRATKVYEDAIAQGLGVKEATDIARRSAPPSPPKPGLWESIWGFTFFGFPVGKTAIVVGLSYGGWRIYRARARIAATAQRVRAAVT